MGLYKIDLIVQNQCLFSMMALVNVLQHFPISLGNPTAIANLLIQMSCHIQATLIVTSLSSSFTLSLFLPFNFQITGVILLAVGVWGKLTLGTYISLIAENSTNAPYVLIGTGTTIVVFGLFGCFATCRGSPWMLKLVSMSQHHTAFSIPFCNQSHESKVAFLKATDKTSIFIYSNFSQTLT